MKTHEILIERVINLLEPEDKAKYADAIWDLLQRSYSNIPGGFASAENPEELVNTPGIWKIVKRDGTITAVTLYKDQYGRKSYAAGTETAKDPVTGKWKATPQGKKDYTMIRSADQKLKRAWGEVSGAPEELMRKTGAIPIPNKFAAFLTGKKILDLNPDGFHYTRDIAGKPHEKAIYGFINLNPNDLQKVLDQGIKLHNLPFVSEKD